LGRACVCLQPGRERERVGLKTAQSKEGSPFFQNLFLFSVFPKSFAILQNDLRIQNCLRELETIQSPS
jgi:hypothetical protein